ncbi:hypothetical protein DYB37_012123, partial [Aphanomyces astaci]
MSSGNRAVPVVLQNGSIRFAPVEKSRLIYEHFTKILHDVKLLHSIPHDAQLQMLPLTDHAFRAKIKDIVVPFEVWPKRFVQILASHSDYPTRDHPTKSATRPDFKSARLYLRLVRQSIDVLTPVHADVWFRVLFGMLPVNARF